jgi:hypothetical protein
VKQHEVLSLLSLAARISSTMEDVDPFDFDALLQASNVPMKGAEDEAPVLAEDRSASQILVDKAPNAATDERPVNIAVKFAEQARDGITALACGGLRATSQAVRFVALVAILFTLFSVSLACHGTAPRGGGVRGHGAGVPSMRVFSDTTCVAMYHTVLCHASLVCLFGTT